MSNVNLSTPQVSDTVQTFRAYVQKMLHLQEAVFLMEWDLRTGAPRKGAALRSEALGTLAGEVFRMGVSAEMAEHLQRLSEPDVWSHLDRVTQATVNEVKKEFERNQKIPADRFQEFAVLRSKSETVWAEAREQSNFALFRPYLEKIVEMTKEFIDYWGFTHHPYDTLLEVYEPGMTVQTLDEIFLGLRRETVPLLQAIVGSGRRPNITPFVQPYDIGKQRQLNRLLLERMGYDFSAGRLDATLHPFASTINRYDVRVTTKYLPDDVRSALFSTIHEGGHALYEQAISPELLGTPLSQGTSMGIHESQSRFWENMIGRSRPFWEAHYEMLLNAFPSQLAEVSVDDFYRGINDVRPSLIRIEADEVTYNLHIMIRYEIEKGLIDGSLRVNDLPEIWRGKMQEYLGVVPETDADGVLQDVHWSDGSFGYFPSYALGNIYAAQFRHALVKAIPNYEDEVRRGNLKVIKNWLNENIHQYGKLLQPAEIIEKVTGEQVTSKYLIEYFHEKYGSLYAL